MNDLYRDHTACLSEEEWFFYLMEDFPLLPEQVAAMQDHIFSCDACLDRSAATLQQRYPDPGEHSEVAAARPILQGPRSWQAGPLRAAASTPDVAAGKLDLQALEPIPYVTVGDLELFRNPYKTNGFVVGRMDLARHDVELSTAGGGSIAFAVDAFGRFALTEAEQATLEVWLKDGVEIQLQVK